MSIEELMNEIYNKESELQNMYDVLQELKRTTFKADNDKIGKIYKTNSNLFVCILGIRNSGYMVNEIYINVDDISLYENEFREMNEDEIIYEEISREELIKQLSLQINELCNRFWE